MTGGRAGEAASADDWRSYLEGLEVFGMRPGLERVGVLLVRLGDPQRSFRAIHVVGTNGKSSTTRYGEAVLRAHGAASGAYLSPHISGWEERVLVGGQPVASELLGGAVTRVREASARLPADLGPVTQFEVLTVAAFVALAEAGVTAAVVEAGLGGRLDATNVLQAPVVILTTIGLEHTDVLGNTRAAILAEKVAVVHGGDVVIGDLEGLEPLAEQACRRAGARAHVLGRDVNVRGEPRRFWVATAASTYAELAVPTLANYQVVNAGLAVAACELFLGRLDGDAVRAALRGTAVPGRLQVVGRRPLVLADGAHNPDGVRALAASLAAMVRPAPRVGVVAVMGDKDVAGMARLLGPLFDAVVCTQAGTPRSLPAGDLAEAFRRAAEDDRSLVAALSGEGAAKGHDRARSGDGGASRGRLYLVAEPDARAAFERAGVLAGGRGSVVVTGSLYLLEDLGSLLVGEGA